MDDFNRIKPAKQWKNAIANEASSTLFWSLLFLPETFSRSCDLNSNFTKQNKTKKPNPNTKNVLSRLSQKQGFPIINTSGSCAKGSHGGFLQHQKQIHPWGIFKVFQNMFSSKQEAHTWQKHFIVTSQPLSISLCKWFLTLLFCYLNIMVLSSVPEKM